MGTARDSHLKKCPLLERKTAETSLRGVLRYKPNKGLLAMKWKDKKAVTLVTNLSSTIPLRALLYWSSQMKKIRMKQPNLTHEYNQHMGEVDLEDGQ